MVTMFITTTEAKLEQVSSVVIWGGGMDPLIGVE